MAVRQQASWAKMMSPGGKLTALVCHLIKKVNKTEELTLYLYKHCLSVYSWQAIPA